MKLTEARLRQIIREELNSQTSTIAFFDYAGDRAGRYEVTIYEKVKSFTSGDPNQIARELSDSNVTSVIEQTDVDADVMTPEMLIAAIKSQLGLTDIHGNPITPQEYEFDQDEDEQ